MPQNKLILLDLKKVIFYVHQLYLQSNVYCDDHEGIDEAHEEPYLYWFDGWCVGQGVGDGEVDGGEHHHAGDVHRDNEFIAGLTGDIIGHLIDKVHEECW